MFCVKAKPYCNTSIQNSTLTLKGIGCTCMFINSSKFWLVSTALIIISEAYANKDFFILKTLEYVAVFLLHNHFQKNMKSLLFL